MIYKMIKFAKSLTTTELDILNNLMISGDFKCTKSFYTEYSKRLSREISNVRKDILKLFYKNYIVLYDKKGNMFNYKMYATFDLKPKAKDISKMCINTKLIDLL